MRDLNRTSDDDLISGRLGVFASEWVDATQEPRSTGNYLVVVRQYEPVIALYLSEMGWDLTDTLHAGLEDLITHWMLLPQPPKEEANGQQ